MNKITFLTQLLLLSMLNIIPTNKLKKVQWLNKGQSFTIIIVVVIIRVMCVSRHFNKTRLFSNSSFSVLYSKNFEVMRLAATRYDETNINMHLFLILNMEKPKILNSIFFGDNKNSLSKLFLQTIIMLKNQFISYEFN